MLQVEVDLCSIETPISMTNLYLSPFLCVSADQIFIDWPKSFYLPLLSLLKLEGPQDWSLEGPFHQLIDALYGLEKGLNRVTIIHSLAKEKTIDSLQTPNYYSCYTIMICNTAICNYRILVCLIKLLVISEFWSSDQPS